MQIVAKNSYIAKSRASKEALKSANLLKSLNLNVIITGEKGVGKKSLARYIYAHAPIVDGSFQEELIKAIGTNDRLIIKNFDKIENFEKIKILLEKKDSRIIATSSKQLNPKIEDEFFSLKIYIPPLSQRFEDVTALSQMFLDEAKEVFGDLSSDFDLEKIVFDLSENSYSLRKSVYKAYFKSLLSEDDVMEVLEGIFCDKLGGGNDYRELLYLFESPLIKCGFEKFGSQLAMSKAFGLNRNTLRKKINEYGFKESKK